MSRPTLRPWRQLTEQLTIYLPVLLMALLALGTWWLVRNAPKTPEVSAPRAASHEPDYYMRDFSVKKFDVDGRLQSEVKGSVLRHFQDTDTLEIDQARLRMVSAQGQVTTASADRALSNSDGSEVQLLGNAQVIRQPLASAKGQPRLEFQGNFLHVWANEERVRSHQPVTLLRGNDRFTGDSLDYDHLHEVLQLQGRVRASMQASPR